MNRRTLLSLAAAAAASLSFPTVAKAALPQVEVYKNPDCGCVEPGWIISRLPASRVSVHDTSC